MSVSILVVDDEPDVAELLRQRFRHETRQGTYVMHFAGYVDLPVTLAEGVPLVRWRGKASIPVAFVLTPAPTRRAPKPGPSNL